MHLIHKSSVVSAPLVISLLKAHDKTKTIIIAPDKYPPWKKSFEAVSLENKFKLKYLLRSYFPKQKYLKLLFNQGEKQLNKKNKLAQSHPGRLQ